MEKKQLKTQQKTSALTLYKETLWQLEDSELQEVAGVARMWKPLGFAEDTTPIYSYEDQP